MAIDVYLDKMDDLIEEARNLPFTAGKKMVDIDKMRDLIDEVRLNIPREIKEAKLIVSDREDIISDAKKEAEQIIAVAEQKARALVSDEEIIRNAKERATQMLSESGQRAREIQRASIEFSENTLLKAEQTLTDTLAEVKKVRTAIRAKK